MRYTYTHLHSTYARMYVCIYVCMHAYKFILTKVQNERGQLEKGKS
jgi:hypothetical protein